MRRMNSFARVLTVQVALAVAAQTSAAQTALDCVEALYAHHGVCVISSLEQDELSDIEVGRIGADADSAMACLEQGGLSVFEARGQHTVAVVDLRPTRGGEPAEDPVVLASRLLGGLSKGAWERQRSRSGPQCTCPTFPLSEFSGPETEECVDELRRALEGRRSLGASLHGLVSWQPCLLLRDDSAEAASITRPRGWNWFYRHPPFGPLAQQGDSFRSLLWGLWDQSGTEWAVRPCPDIPQGQIDLERALDAACEGSEGCLVVDESVDLRADAPLYIAGQPSSLGVLVWALQVCAGVMCRTTQDVPDVGQVSYPVRIDEPGPGYWCSAPGRGYVSPRLTQFGRAMLQRTDYGGLIPLHAQWKLSDLPLMYTWTYAANEEQASPDQLSLIWLRTVSFGLAGAESASSDARWQLPLL